METINKKKYGNGNNQISIENKHKASFNTTIRNIKITILKYEVLNYSLFVINVVMVIFQYSCRTCITVNSIHSSLFCFSFQFNNHKNYNHNHNYLLIKKPNHLI